MLLLNLLFHFAASAAVPLNGRLKTAEFERNRYEHAKIIEPTVITKSPNEQEQRVCRTKHCNEIATEILRNIDTSVDPCDNFYQYACGNWERHNPIPDTQLEWSEDHKNTEVLYSHIKTLLEEEDKPTDLPPIKMARQLYRSCMDTERLERQGIKPLIKILNRDGGWPILMSKSTSNSQQISWQEIDMRHILLIGDSSFYSIGYERSDRNTSVNILTIDHEVQYPMKREKSAENSISDYSRAYINGIVNVVRAFAKEQGIVLNRGHLIKELPLMVQFEQDFQGIVEEQNSERGSNEEESTMTIAELEEWYNSLNITAPTANIKFLETIQYAFRKADIHIDASEPIIVRNKTFLEKLAKLLAATPERVIVNYIQWNTVNTFMMYTNEEMRQIKFNMFYGAYNITKQPPRWKDCISGLEMKDAVSYLYVNKYFSDDIINPVTEMVEMMQEEFQLRIMRAKWIGDDFKNFMKDKLTNIVKLIGYPDWYRNDTALLKRYEGLTVGPDYLQNILNCLDIDLTFSLKEYKELIPRTEWSDFPITMNAFYSESTNAIIIPAAELQEPYFTKHLPDAVNYGSIGFLLGHELSHSLDNDGIHRDKNGNKISWNSSQVLHAYDLRAGCFTSQFDNYTLDVLDDDGNPIQIDGELTEDENMADSTGTQVAFAAYTKAKLNRKEQLKLPGLEDRSDDEIFFLSFANAWCMSSKPKYAADTANQDEHSPPKFRVIGSLSNMNSFAQTFKCSDRSRMNPPKKCSLWK